MVVIIGVLLSLLLTVTSGAALDEDVDSITHDIADAMVVVQEESHGSLRGGARTLAPPPPPPTKTLTAAPSTPPRPVMSDAEALSAMQSLVAKKGGLKQILSTQSVMQWKRDADAKHDPSVGKLIAAVKKWGMMGGLPFLGDRHLTHHLAGLAPHVMADINGHR
jgi:hypothetical protein